MLTEVKYIHTLKRYLLALLAFNFESMLIIIIVIICTYIHYYYGGRIDEG